MSIAAWMGPEKVPAGTVLAVIREENPREVTRMTHVGIIIQEHGEAYVRHAASGPNAGVRDEEVSHFVQRNARLRPCPMVAARHTSSDRSKIT